MQVSTKEYPRQSQRNLSSQSGQFDERKVECLSNVFHKAFQAGAVCVALSPMAVVLKMSSLDYAPVAALVSFIAIALLFEYKVLPS